MAYRTHRVRSGGSKRATSWFDISITSTGVDNSSVLVNSLTALELARRPFTVVRTYLEILQLSDQAVATEQMHAAIGMCVVSDQAAAIGVSAVPTPITDDDSDLWYIHKFMLSGFAFSSAVGFDERLGRQYTIESKAMRKVNDAEDLIVVVEGSSLGEGQTLVTAGRVLIKEH